MGATIKIPLNITGVTQARDVLEYLSASTRGVRLKRWYMTSDQTASQKQELRISRITGAPTSGSGGSTPTAVADQPLVGSTGGTIETWNSTRLSGGTAALLATLWWDKREVLDYVPIDDKSVIEIEGGTRLLLGMETAPSASASYGGFVELEVIA